MDSSYLTLLKKSTPDMVILDISMPQLRGLEATIEIKTLYPKVKVLILTMHNNKEYLNRPWLPELTAICLKKIRIHN